MTNIGTVFVEDWVIFKVYQRIYWTATIGTLYQNSLPSSLYILVKTLWGPPPFIYKSTAKCKVSRPSKPVRTNANLCVQLGSKSAYGNSINLFDTVYSATGHNHSNQSQWRTRCIDAAVKTAVFLPPIFRPTRSPASKWTQNVRMPDQQQVPLWQKCHTNCTASSRIILVHGQNVSVNV